MSLIQTNYEQMYAASSSLKSTAASMQSELDDLRSRLQAMDWEGDDRTSYDAHQAKWDSAIADLNQILTSIGNRVSTACDNYVATEASNSKVWTA